MVEPLTDPGLMFAQDVIAERREIPLLNDPERIAVLEFHTADYEDGRVPDIVTRRTKAYVVRWDLKCDRMTFSDEHERP